MTKKLLIGTVAVVAVAILGITLFGGKSMARAKLNTKQQHIATIAAATSRGDMETLTVALNNALDDGLTINEGKEILVQLYAYCGFPRSLNAITNMMNVVNDRQSKGIKDTVGVEPTPLTQDVSTRNQIGGETRENLSGRPFSAAFADFTPAIDDFLKEHLFADIFARGVLTNQEREIATIAALAAKTGVAGQLAGHIAIGKNQGLTDEQVSEILYIATKPTDIMFGFGIENNIAGQYFTGKSYLSPISTEQVGVFNVTFEPTVRNNWHIHHGGGQILLATHGRGWYQEWGKPAIELKPGDKVNIAPGTKHWHGAAKDSWFTHIAIEVPSENGHTEWFEPVTDEEYNKLK